jgi:hypothetical protein
MDGSRGGIVLLLGLGRPGTSTLGNFLADPDTFRDATKSAFARGSRDLALTKARSCAVSSYNEQRSNTRA